MCSTGRPGTWKSASLWRDGVGAWARCCGFSFNYHAPLTSGDPDWINKRARQLSWAMVHLVCLWQICVWWDTVTESPRGEPAAHRCIAQGLGRCRCWCMAVCRAHTLSSWICLKDAEWDIPSIICSKLVLEIKSPGALSMNWEELLKK